MTVMLRANGVTREKIFHHRGTEITERMGFGEWIVFGMGEGLE